MGLENLQKFMMFGYLSNIEDCSEKYGVKKAFKELLYDKTFDEFNTLDDSPNNLTNKFEATSKIILFWISVVESNKEYEKLKEITALYIEFVQKYNELVNKVY